MIEALDRRNEWVPFLLTLGLIRLAARTLGEDCRAHHWHSKSLVFIEAKPQLFNLLSSVRSKNARLRKHSSQSTRPDRPNPILDQRSHQSNLSSRMPRRAFRQAPIMRRIPHLCYLRPKWPERMTAIRQARIGGAGPERAAKRKPPFFQRIDLSDER